MVKYQQYYDEHRQELIKAVKQEGYTLQDIMDNKSDLSSKQFIVEYFS